MTIKNLHRHNRIIDVYYLKQYNFLNKIILIIRKKKYIVNFWKRVHVINVIYIIYINISNKEEIKIESCSRYIFEKLLKIIKKILVIKLKLYYITTSTNI